MLFHVHLVKQCREKYNKNTLMGAAQDASQILDPSSQRLQSGEQVTDFYSYYCKMIRLVKGVWGDPTGAPVEPRENKKCSHFDIIMVKLGALWSPAILSKCIKWNLWTGFTQNGFGTERLKWGQEPILCHYSHFNIQYQYIVYKFTLHLWQ